MHKDRYVFIINPEARAIAVVYKNEHGDTETPTIFKTLDQSIKKDDLVVIPTKTRVGFTVAAVKAVDVDFDLESNEPIAWIAGAFDPSDYNTTLKQEIEGVAKVRRMEIDKKRAELATAIAGDKAGELQALAIAQPAHMANPAAAAGDPTKPTT